MDESLPQVHIKRIVKAKLAELTAGEPDDKKRDISVQKEALQAFGESAKIFIHYLTATANDVCHDSKRMTINAEDVMKAIDEVEFPEFAEPLREALTAFKAATAEKTQKSLQKKTEKKRKAEDEAGGADDAGAVDDAGAADARPDDSPGGAGLALQEPSMDEDDEDE